MVNEAVISHKRRGGAESQLKPFGCISFQIRGLFKSRGLEIDEAVGLVMWPQLEDGVMNNLFGSIAGVDTDLLKKMPLIDQKRVVQFGIWLIVTYLFITVVVFVGIDALWAEAGGESEEARPLARVAAIFGISQLVALSLVFFDRRFIQSELLEEVPIDDMRFDANRLASPKTYIAFTSFSKFALRIGISVIIALALYLLAALALFQDDLVAEIDRYHTQQNMTLFDELDGYSESYDAVTQDLRTQINDVTERGASTDQRLVDLQMRRVEVEKQSRAYLAEADLNRSKAIAEETGQNPLGLEGISGDPRCLARCKGYLSGARKAQNQYDLSVEQLQSLDRQIDAAKTDRENIGQDAAHLRNEVSIRQANRNTVLLQERERLTSRGDYVEPSFGPRAQVSALIRLREDPETGPGQRLIEWTMKVFFMLLELMPVLAVKLIRQPTGIGPAMLYTIRKSQLQSHAEFISDTKTIRDSIADEDDGEDRRLLWAIRRNEFTKELRAHLRNSNANHLNTEGGHLAAAE